MKISESIIQFIWKYRLFKQTEISTLSGKRIRIEKVGHHNFDEGPDFENAIINIDGIDWVGNVEIHINSSEWINHKHHLNPNYNNVILHVVFTYDSEIKRQDGTIPETLELKPLINEQTIEKHLLLERSIHWIPCEKLIHSVDSFHKYQWLNRVLIERLADKSSFVYNLLSEYQGNWEQAAYILIARNFGFNVNADAFEQLARSLPYTLLQKYKHNSMAIEALIFGQSGLLEEEFHEEYPLLLQKEYSYLRKAHSLKPIEKTNWKFLRMRPWSFPTLRLAQFASFCFEINHFFAKIIEIENLDLWRIKFNALIVNEYWLTHYHFKKTSAKHSTQLGEKAIDLILINTVVVLLFSYGKYLGNEDYIDLSVSFLEKMKPENNRIIQGYKDLGVEVKSAADTQALKQLKTVYCDKKRCLECEIGYQIIKKT